MPFLFISLIEALPRELCTGTSCELLYADDLVVRRKTGNKTDEMKNWIGCEKFKSQSGKDKIPWKTGKYPCSFSRNGAGYTFTLCSGYNHWVHKKSLMW